MPKTAPVPPHMQPATPLREVQPQTRIRAAVRYSACFVLLVLMALCGAFWVAGRPWFLDHDDYPDLKVVGYGLRARGMNCQIVLYGDSTALVGLDPNLIGRETGLTACNIAEERPVEEVVGVHFPLDSYLAHNPRPMFLVTAWAAPDFDLEHPPMNEYFSEGYLYAFQNDRGPWLWKALIRHPKDAISFLLWVEKGIWENVIHVARFRSPQVDERPARDLHNGAWQSALPPQVRCEAIRPLPWLSHDQYKLNVAQFRKRYAAKADHVLVDITPVADCLAEGPSRIASVSGLYDNTAQRWPVSSFGSLNVHLTPQAATRFSEQVARQIESILQQEHNAAGGRGSPPR